jgi:hypothetical protein
MENITLNAPYKIIQSKLKRYSSHYNIPGIFSLIIPRKKYGDQNSCDVWWKDSLGELQHKPNLMFDGSYLQPINPLFDIALVAMWDQANTSHELITEKE